MEHLLKLAWNKFNNACYGKLEKKEKEGFEGWNNPDFEWTLKLKLKEHLKKEWTAENLVDISNLCDFLWNLKQEEMEMLAEDDE